MAETTADILLGTIHGWGVDVIFGLPGDSINGIMESLRTCQDKIRFIQVRHEEAAAFMACGWAKFTGRLGCCLATSGPGGIHLLNGLYDAKMDKACAIPREAAYASGRSLAELQGLRDDPIRLRGHLHSVRRGQSSSYRPCAAPP